MDPVPARNALSRRDNETFICSPCGVQEAFEDLNSAPKRAILPLSSVSHDIAVIAETLGDEQELYKQYAERIAEREAREIREAFAEQGILEFE